jgi:hypothetical protein
MSTFESTKSETEQTQLHQRARRSALRAAMAVAGLLGTGCGVSVEGMGSQAQDAAADTRVVSDASPVQDGAQTCESCLPLLGGDPNQGCNGAYLRCLADLRMAGMQCDLGCLAWGPFVPVAMEG